jgi:hypothetical protein
VLEIKEPAMVEIDPIKNSRRKPCGNFFETIENLQH